MASSGFGEVVSFGVLGSEPLGLMVQVLFELYSPEYTADDTAIPATKDATGSPRLEAPQPLNP